MRLRLAGELGEDRGPAGPGMIERLEHEHRRTLARYEPPPGGVKRAAGLRGRVVKAGGERPGLPEAGEQQGCQGRLGAAGENNVGVAMGDVAGGRFTHEAGYQAGLVIRNALFGLPVKATAVIPRVTYTDPELAEAGLGETEARSRYGARVRVLRWPFRDNDRAQAEGHTEGLVKVTTGPSGRILGAGIVGPQAGELIQPWLLALAQGLRISAMTGTVLPYPTRGEAGRRAALNYFQDFASNRLVRGVIRLMSALRP